MKGATGGFWFSDWLTNLQTVVNALFQSNHVDGTKLKLQWCYPSKPHLRFTKIQPQAWYIQPNSLALDINWKQLNSFDRCVKTPFYVGDSEQADIKWLYSCWISALTAAPWYSFQAELAWQCVCVCVCQWAAGTSWCSFISTEVLTLWEITHTRHKHSHQPRFTLWLTGEWSVKTKK